MKREKTCHEVYVYIEKQNSDFNKTKTHLLPQEWLVRLNKEKKLPRGEYILTKKKTSLASSAVAYWTIAKPETKKN